MFMELHLMLQVHLDPSAPILAPVDPPARA